MVRVRGLEVSEKKPLSWTSKGKRQQFFSDPAIDHMAAIVMSLASEFWSLRERVYVLETLAEQSGSFTRSDVERYELSTAQRSELDGLRSEFMERLLFVLREELDDVKAKSEA